MNSQLCICNSGKAFSRCCLPLIDQQRVAKTPPQLVRSRYSAYALGGYGSYLLNTWLPSTSIGLDEASLSLKSVDWQGLEIISNSQQGDSATVEFKAYFNDNNHNLSVHHEVSEFVRQGGRWFYWRGKTKTGIA